MTARVTSRRADTGLPEVANDYAFDDPLLGRGTYFDDGYTWTDAAGSVLAGAHDEIKMRPRLKGRALRHAFGE